MASDRIQRRINQLLDEADGAVAALDWDVVRSRAEAVLAFDPENKEAIAYRKASDRGHGQLVPDSLQATSSTPPTTLPDQPSSFNSDRLLGLLAHTMGNLEQATAHFEEALTISRNIGFRPELAWSCCEYADVLLQRAESVRGELVEQPGPSTSPGRTGEGDRAKAVSLLDESLAISSELGMRPLMERVLSRREILGA